MNGVVVSLQLRGVHGSSNWELTEWSYGSVYGLDLELGAGVYHILGTPKDGSVAFWEVVTGRIKPNAGTVRLNGRDPARRAELRRRIAALGPQVELPPARTVTAVIGLVARAWTGGPNTGAGNRKGIREQAAAVLESFGLTALGQRNPAALSPGEWRSVELAIALSVPQPLLVALYEPFVDTALVNRVVVKRRIRELAASGSCVIVCSSTSHEVDSTADGVYLLRRGQLATRDVTCDQRDGAVGEIVLWLDPKDRHATRCLLAALTERLEIDGVRWRQADNIDGLDLLSVHTQSRRKTALFVAQECVHSGANVRAWRSPTGPYEAKGGPAS